MLRKGCSDDCSIRPCLEWIKSPDAQANATVFLAKFYGRAGLINLINAGSQHLRPAIFRSLLYEACGRIVNPIYGSVGLMWSGSWQLCQSAVEAVLKGAPITQIASEAAETKKGPPLKVYDIRHVNKDDNHSESNDVHRVRTRCRFKRSGAKAKRSRVWVGSAEESGCEEDAKRSPSHGSSLSHQSEATAVRESRDSGSLASAEADQGTEQVLDSDNGEIELDLSLGLKPFKRCPNPRELAVKGGGVGREAEDDEAGVCKMELGLDYPVS